MRRLLAYSTLVVAFLATAPQTADARPPLCKGEIGVCSWETLVVDGYWFMMTECPGGEGGLHLISYGDALAVCSGR